MEKENWINDILDSTNGMTAAVPDASLFSKIQNKIQHGNAVSPQWVWLAAASVVVLVCINVSMVFMKSKKEKVPTEVIAAALSKSNQLY